MSHSRVTATGVVLLVVILAAGCGPSLRAQEAVTIGVLAPLTSGVPAAAKSAVQGATLAAEEVNASGGVARAQLAVQVYDDRGSPEEAGRRFEQLAGQKAVAIVGPLTDATAIAVAPLAERGGIPLISPGATGTIPYAGSSFFRTSLPADAQARTLAEFVVRVRGGRRVTLIQDSNEYGTLVALAFAERVRSLGGSVVGTRFYRDGETDFSRHATGAVADGAAAVFVAGYPDEGAHILAALRHRGVQALIVGSDALYSGDLVAWAGGHADGIHLPAAFLASDPLPVVQEFVGKYRRRYNEAPDHFAAQAYDAVKIVAFALRRGGRSPQAVRTALQGLRKFPGVTGEITFDRWGAPARPVGIVRVRAGTFEVAQH